MVTDRQLIWAYELMTSKTTGGAFAWTDVVGVREMGARGQQSLEFHLPDRPALILNRIKGNGVQLGGRVIDMSSSGLHRLACELSGVAFEPWRDPAPPPVIPISPPPALPLPPQRPVSPPPHPVPAQRVAPRRLLRHRLRRHPPPPPPHSGRSRCRRNNRRPQPPLRPRNRRRNNGRHRRPRRRRYMGWYPDPWRQARVRWWDGRRWTEHTQR